MTPRRTPRGTVTVLLVVCVAALAAAGCSPVRDDDRNDPTAGLVAAVQRYLTEGEGRLDRLTAGQAAAGAELDETAANVAALGITGLRLRPLDARSRSGLPVVARAEGAGRVVDVEVTWRLAEQDTDASRLVVPFLLTRVGDDVVFRTARLAGDRHVPLWLVTPLAVRRTATGLVAAADGSRLAELVVLQERAAAAVASVLPGWDGGLVVEAPVTARQYATSTGTEPTTPGEGQLAAVATTADGRRVADSALRVHLHPDQFWRLGPRGRQVVLTHEAAHVALRSPLEHAPAWLAEGLADHVALRDSGIAVRDAAAGALGMVRRSGLPSALPTDAQLTGADGYGDDRGAWYEAAWLAVRMLAERYGEAKVVDLYRAAARDGATDRVLQEVLGTTQAEVVSDWRVELERLARLQPAA